MSEEKKRHIVIAVALIALGYSLTVTSEFILKPAATQPQPQKVFAQLIEKLGLSLLIGGISYGILKYLTSEIKEEVRASTLSPFLGSKQKLHEVFDEYYLKSRDELQVVGVILSNFFSEKVTPEGLVDKIRCGCHIKLCFLDTNSKAFYLRAQEENQQEEYYIEGFKRVLERIRKIEKLLIDDRVNWNNYRGRIDIFLVNSLPYFSYLRADDRMIVGFYNRIKDCRESPCLALSKDNEFFDLFTNELLHLTKNYSTQVVFSFQGSRTPTLTPVKLTLPTKGFLSNPRN